MPDLELFPPSHDLEGSRWSNMEMEWATFWRWCFWILLTHQWPISPPLLYLTFYCPYFTEEGTEPQSGELPARSHSQHMVEAPLRHSAGVQTESWAGFPRSPARRDELPCLLSSLCFASCAVGLAVGTLSFQRTADGAETKKKKGTTQTVTLVGEFAILGKRNFPGK